MSELTIEQLDRVDDVFAGNSLLSTFTAEARALIEPFGTMLEIGSGDVVLNRGDQVQATLFPLGSTLVSMTVVLSDGRTVETALIGRKGAVGGIVSCGHAPAYTRAFALVGGPAFSVPMETLEEAKRRSPFIANLFCRFSDYLLAQA